MFFRRSKRSIEDDPDERRHREDVGLARRGIELARRNNRLQISAIAVALTSLLVAILLALPSPADRTVPRAQVALASSFVDGVIPNSIFWLGSPPRYAGSEVDDHCELWWDRWFQGKGAAPYPSERLVEVTAPAGADATITGAAMHVFRSYKPAVLSLIQCARKGGPEPGTILNVNLDRPDAPPTIVSDSGELTPLLAMPDAVIKISAGDAEYIDIVPGGSSRFYDWSLSLTVVVDQHKTVVTFGSLRNPLRSWLGAVLPTAYDYFQASHSWQPAQ